MITSARRLLVSIGFCLVTAAAFAEEKPAAASEKVVILQGTITQVKMTSRQPIRTIQVENEKCIKPRGFGETKAVRLEGVAPGTSRLILTDVDGKKETIEVEVRSNIRTLSVGGTIQLQMTKKQPIKTIINERDDVVRVLPMYGDPTTVLVIGRAPGRTRVTLVSADGKKENIEFGKPSPR